MSDVTLNYSLILPEVGGDAELWAGYTNANWTSLDTIVKDIDDRAIDTPKILLRSAAQVSANVVQQTLFSLSVSNADFANRVLVLHIDGFSTSSAAAPENCTFGVLLGDSPIFGQMFVAVKVPNVAASSFHLEVRIMYNTTTSQIVTGSVFTPGITSDAGINSVTFNDAPFGGPFVGEFDTNVATLTSSSLLSVTAQCESADTQIETRSILVIRE